MKNKKKEGSLRKGYKEMAKESLKVNKEWETTDLDWEWDDDFGDMMKLSEQSLKKVWDNKEDEVWNKYLKSKKKKHKRN